MMKYVKSFVYEHETVYNWMSGLLCFVDEGELIMDSGFLITGDVSPDYYAHYLNYKRFTLFDEELHYMYADKLKAINPDKVYLHIRIGHSPAPIQTSHLSYWHLYATSPNNKFFKSFEFNTSRLRVVHEPNNNGKKLKVSDIKNPLFYTKQSYNESSIMFSGLNMKLLYEN